MLGLSGVGAVVNLFTYGGNGLLCERINGVDGFLTFDPSGNTVQSLSSSQSVNYSHLVTGFGSQLAGGSTSDAYDGLGAQWGYRRESGNLFLLGHRYYSSQRGQFLTRDPIGYGGGVNLYGYVGNNPANWSDPDGTQAVIPAPVAGVGLFLLLWYLLHNGYHPGPIYLNPPWSHPTTVFPGEIPHSPPISQFGPNVDSPREVGLPVGKKCPYPYIPGRNWKPGKELPGRVGRNGQPEYEDSNGNFWKKGPPHHFPDDPKEWDVTDPNTGKHINVGISGGENAGVVRGGDK